MLLECQGSQASVAAHGPCILVRGLTAVYTDQ